MIGCGTPNKVRAWMTSNPFSIDLEMLIEDLSEIMGWRHIRNIPVVDSTDRLVGLVTYRELLDSLFKEASPANFGESRFNTKAHTVRDLMKTNVATCSPDYPVSDAVKLLADSDHDCLIVTEDRKVVGIVTEADFVRFLHHLNSRS